MKPIGKLSSKSGLRLISVYEAGKGLLVLTVGTGLLALLHHDVQAFGEYLISHLHLNPAHHYPRIFLNALEKVNDRNLILIAAGAMLYAVVRFIEAYGLWRERAWAEWFAIFSGAIYLPFEFYELAVSVTPLKVGLTVVNLVIILWLYRLRLSSKADVQKR